MIDYFEIFEKQSPKNKIFNILTVKNNISAKKIHNTLKKQFSTGTTYQSTFKILNSMVENKILKKSDLKYEINIKWITKQRDYLNSIISSIYKINNCTYSSEFIKIFKFNTLKEIDSFIQEGVLTLAKKNKIKQTYWKTPHCWWLLSNPIDESMLIGEYGKVQLQTNALITKNSRLDIVAKKYYQLNKTTYQSIIIKNTNNSEVVQIIGDYIFLIDLPNEILIELDKIYQLKKTSEILPPIIELVSRKINLEIKVIKNKKIAQTYINEITSN